jgi:hypothetical protein
MKKRTLIVASIMLGLAMMLADRPARAQLVGSFVLKPNPATVACLRSKPGVMPSATVIVGQGVLADDLTITGSGIKPGLAFDLFTVEKSSLLKLYRLMHVFMRPAVILSPGGLLAEQHA